MSGKHCRCRKGAVPRAFTRQGFTLYNRLELDKEKCNEADIKNAYNNLATENHPSKHPGDEEKRLRYKEVSEAYAVLSDHKKKAVYDKFGSLGIHVGEIVGYHKVQRYLTKRSAGYKFTTVMLFLLTGCCFCCCCYFCFCFCCGLCIPKKDDKTWKAIQEGRAVSQSPYNYEKKMTHKPISWEEKDRVVTEQPRDNVPKTKTPFVEIRDSDSSETKTDSAKGKDKEEDTNQGKKKLTVRYETDDGREKNNDDEGKRTPDTSESKDRTSRSRSRKDVSTERRTDDDKSSVDRRSRSPSDRKSRSKTHIKVRRSTSGHFSRSRDDKDKERLSSEKKSHSRSREDFDRSSERRSRTPDGKGSSDRRSRRSRSPGDADQRGRRRSPEGSNRSNVDENKKVSTQRGTIQSGERQSERQPRKKTTSKVASSVRSHNT